MPLGPSTLAQQLSSIAENPPPSSAACGQAWANAVGAYAASVVPPSTTVSAATSTLAGALAGAFASPAAAPGMETAFLSFATTLGLGMAGAGFTGAPPVAPVGFAPQFAGPKPLTHDAAAQTLATLIDTWMKTGIATLIAPPNTPQPWT